MDYPKLKLDELMKVHNAAIENYYSDPKSTAVIAQLYKIDEELAARKYKVLIQEKDAHPTAAARFRTKEECQAFIEKSELQVGVWVNQGKYNYLAEIEEINFGRDELKAEVDVGTIKKLIPFNSKKVYVDKMPGVIDSHFWTPTTQKQGGYSKVDFRLAINHQLAPQEILTLVKGLTFAPVA